MLPIQPGNYAVASPFLVPFTFTVPSGWSGNIGGPNLVELNESQSDGRSYISMEIFNNVYADPCHSEQGMLNPPLGSSVDDLVAALSKMPSVTASAISDGTIGGVASKQLTLTASNVVVDGMGCTLTSDGQLPIWALPLGAINGLYPGDSQQLSILEVDGQRLVVVSDYVSNDAPISGVLDSIRFTPKP